MQIEELTAALAQVGGLPIQRLLDQLTEFSARIEIIGDDIWTQEQCLRNLNVSVDTLHGWIADGMPVVRKGRKSYYIKSDLIKWMRDTSDASVSDAAAEVLARLNAKKRR